MAHVLLGDKDKVTNVFSRAQPDRIGYAEIADDDPRIAEFYTPTVKEEATKELQATDSAMFRALEQLIDVLIEKRVISAKDLPPRTEELYSERKGARERLNQASVAEDKH